MIDPTATRRRLPFPEAIALSFTECVGVGRDLSNYPFQRRQPEIRTVSVSGRSGSGLIQALAAKFAHVPEQQVEIYGLLGDTDRAREALARPQT